MSEELMDEFELITITSEDGTEEFFAEADSVEYEGKTFILLVPVTEEGELREEADPILARIEEEDGELNLMPSLPSLKKHRLKKRNN